MAQTVEFNRQMLQAMWEENNSIQTWKERVKNVDVSDIVIVDLLDIGRGIVFEKPGVLVQRKDVQKTESWLFVKQAYSSHEVKKMLTEELSQKISGLASKIGVSEDTVLDAAIKTKTLMDHPQDNGQPVFVQFGERPEGLRLAPSESVIRGYTLEYYISPLTEIGSNLRWLFDTRSLQKLSFPVLFRPVLAFASHVASKK